MKILFAHNSFLGQFEYFAKWLLDQGHEVAVVHQNVAHDPDPRFTRVQFDPLFSPTPNLPYLVKEANNAISNGAGAAKALIKLRESGYTPDAMIAHCGWGTGLMLRNVWPDAVYIAYHEWFYQDNPVNNTDYISKIQAEPGKAPTIETVAHDLARNFPILAEFVNADACWSPNKFQAGQFPPYFQDRITVLHDGVDTEVFKPDPIAKIDFDWLNLENVEQIVTYVGRGFEPIRGFPDFMRAIKQVQQDMPKAHVVIIGENRIAYGGQLPDGDTWLHRMLDQLDLDMSRIHLTGRLSYQDYKRILQGSSAHVYLTTPFVLSWSFSEALATGCNVIASDLPAVREIAENGRHATLVEPGNIPELSKAIKDILKNPDSFRKQRDNARRRMINRYAAKKIFPKKLEIIKNLVEHCNSGVDCLTEASHISSDVSSSGNKAR